VTHVTATFAYNIVPLKVLKENQEKDFNLEPTNYKPN